MHDWSMTGGNLNSHTREYSPVIVNVSADQEDHGQCCLFLA